MNAASPDSMANERPRNMQGSLLTINSLLQISKPVKQMCKSFELTIYIVVSKLQFGTIFGDYVTARRC